jgi:hypothetical protein
MIQPSSSFTDHESVTPAPLERLSLVDYIGFGLLTWGIAGSTIIGYSAIIYALVTCIPLLLLRIATPHAEYKPVRCYRIAPIIAAILVIYAIDAILNGRYQMSLFWPGSVDTFIEGANESVGQGRGFGQLIVAGMAFLPILTIDIFRSRYRRLPLAAAIVVLFLITYEAGISRGFLMLGIVASLAAYAKSKMHLAYAGLFALVAFNVASYFRGDFGVTQFASPLFDGVIFPYYNLSLAINNGCATYSSADYLVEFLKKFVPAFLFDKEVLSFNIQLSRCIYPAFGDNVESISVFTYMGEILFFSPSLVTCLLMGSILGPLALGCEYFIRKWRLNALRLFVGLLMIFALRSRSLDVASFLIFLLILLVLFNIVASRLRDRPRMQVNARVQ